MIIPKLFKLDQTRWRVASKIAWHETILAQISFIMHIYYTIIIYRRLKRIEVSYERQ